MLGQALRTPKEALALARDDLKSLTALLDLRLIIGDARLAEDVRARARRMTQKRRRRVIAAFADAAREREERPGPIAEMLEPNLKDGAGGLRDLQALGWAGWAIDELGGVGRAGPPRLSARGRSRRRSTRRAPGSSRAGWRSSASRAVRSDVLTLQEQDAVAAALGAESADALVRDLARSSRRVSWIGTDAWRRLQRPGSDSARSRARPARWWRGSSTAVPPASRPTPPSTPPRCCACAWPPPSTRFRIERATLERLRSLAPIEWTPTDREQFVRLLARREVGHSGHRVARRSRGVHVAVPRVGAGPGEAATQRVPPLHRRPASPRGGRGVRGAPRRHRIRR